MYPKMKRLLQSGPQIPPSVKYIGYLVQVFLFLFMNYPHRNASAITPLRPSYLRLIAIDFVLNIVREYLATSWIRMSISIALFMAIVNAAWSLVLQLFAYLRSYAMFRPFLWPKEDPVAIFWLVSRFFMIVSGRYLNHAIASRERVLVDVAGEVKTLPSKEIIWWTILQLIDIGLLRINDWATARFEAASHGKLASFTLHHILTLSPEVRQRENTEELIKAANGSASLYQLMNIICFDICPVSLDLGLAVYYIWCDGGMYMVVNVLVLLVLYGWLSILPTAGINHMRREWLASNVEEEQIFRESISLHSVVTQFNRASFEQDRYDKAACVAMIAHLRWRFETLIRETLQQGLESSGESLALALVFKHVVSGRTSVGALLTFKRHWNRVLGPSKRLTISCQGISSRFVDAERFLRIFSLKPTIVDPEPARGLILNSGKIEFQNVKFAYNDIKPLLQDVTFIAERGKQIALVGRTGSGKSTIMKLLLRYCDVKGGCITIDGQDVRSITAHSLREACGIVSQDMRLFNLSVYKNVCYGRIDSTKQEVEDACKKVGIHDRIMEYPNGYDTICGEGGVALSGGETQLIAIARLIVRDPMIILLDEATSAMDPETEASIQKALIQLFKDRTVLMVTHRLSTVVRANTVLVLDDGQIMEQGTHLELLARGGKYSSFWAEQASGEE